MERFSGCDALRVTSAAQPRRTCQAGVVTLVSAGRRGRRVRKGTCAKLHNLYTPATRTAGPQAPVEGPFDRRALDVLLRFGVTGTIPALPSSRRSALAIFRAWLVRW